LNFTVRRFSAEDLAMVHLTCWQNPISFCPCTTPLIGATVSTYNNIQLRYAEVKYTSVLPASWKWHAVSIAITTPPSDGSGINGIPGFPIRRQAKL
jgi:hypothetical protein